MSKVATGTDWIGIEVGANFYFVPSAYVDESANCYVRYREALTTVSPGVYIEGD